MRMDGVLREQLVRLLRGGMAHMTFDEAVADFPMGRINERFPNSATTPWHLLEHLRFAQRDIIDFMQNPRYQAPQWPRDYWPADDEVATEAQWEETITAFRKELGALQETVMDPSTDLDSRIPWGDGQTILREVLL